MFNRLLLVVSNPRARQGLVFAAFTLGFWYVIFGKDPLNPLEELAIIRNGQITHGVLAEQYEDETDQGTPYVIGSYAFRTPDGRTHLAYTQKPVGSLKPEVDVEYLPYSPETNRVKGDGITSVSSWLWRKIGGSLLMGLLFVVAWIEWLQATPTKTGKASRYEA